MARGENCFVSASGYGAYNLVAEAFAHGINIEAAGAQAKQRRALYLTDLTSGSFVVEPVFVGFEAYRSFYEWLRTYCLNVTQPDTRVGPMRVRIPSRNFDRVGIPSGTYTFGDDAGAFVYRMAVAFRGAKNPTDASAVSRFYPPVARPHPQTGTPQNLAAPYYYPGGTQLGGTEKGEDYLYNNPPNDSPMRPGTAF